MVTVGTQLPFDRLIRIMDGIASDLDEEVFAQIGAGVYRPVHMAWQSRIDAFEFEEKFRSAKVVVGHAGIGTVLMAKRNRKPLILFPRLAALGEHRNNHQSATVKALLGRSGIYVAETEEDLRRFLSGPLELPPEQAANSVQGGLVKKLTDFIEGR